MERKGRVVVTTDGNEAEGIKTSLYFAGGLRRQDFPDALKVWYRVTMRAHDDHARLEFRGEKPPLKIHSREIEVVRKAVGFIATNPEVIEDFYSRYVAGMIEDTTKLSPSGRDAKNAPDLQTRINNIQGFGARDTAQAIETSSIAEEGFQSLGL